MPEYSCRVTLRTANWEVSFENVARTDFTWLSYCQNEIAALLLIKLRLRAQSVQVCFRRCKVGGHFAGPFDLCLEASRETRILMIFEANPMVATTDRANTNNF